MKVLVQVSNHSSNNLIKRLPERHRRQVGLGLEQFTEGLQVFKTQLVGDLADGEIGGR